LAIASPTSGGRSVGIVRSRTQTMEFSLVFMGCIAYIMNLLLKSAIASRLSSKIPKAISKQFCAQLADASETKCGLKSNEADTLHSFTDFPQYEQQIFCNYISEDKL
jgi:hypothetical protein